MKIVTYPSVYVLAKTAFRPSAFQVFANQYDLNATHPDSSDAEALSEVAGRLCYWSFDKPRPGGSAAYLDRIKGEKHGSVIEHASYSFLITGVSRSLTHELVRHRAGWAYSQLSQRYVDESDCAFVLPIEIRPEDDNGNSTPEFREWKAGVQAAHERYCDMVDVLEQKFRGTDEPTREQRTELRKRVRQTARSVLPNCTETKIIATANCRAIRHFLEQRGSAGAEPEIRRLANVILDIVKADSPLIFGDYVTVPHSDSTKIIATNVGKV